MFVVVVYYYPGHQCLLVYISEGPSEPAQAFQLISLCHPPGVECFCRTVVVSIRKYLFIPLLYM